MLGKGWMSTSHLHKLHARNHEIFTSCQATDMEGLLWFALIFTQLLSTETLLKLDNCIRQPRNEVWKKTGQDVALFCSVSPHCPPQWNYTWFVFKQHSHHHINIHGNPLKYKLKGASLQIKSLNTNDSGIYYCAAVRHDFVAASGGQYVGPGTTLSVRGHVKPRHILIWLSFILLVIYSMAIVALIILKKYGCNMSLCRRMCKNGKKLSTRKIQFHNVLQEMNNRGNLERSKPTVAQNSSHAEAANAEFSGSTDDIYQNVSAGQ